VGNVGRNLRIVECGNSRRSGVMTRAQTRRNDTRTENISEVQCGPQRFATEMAHDGMTKDAVRSVLTPIMGSPARHAHRRDTTLAASNGAQP
jgi:hypothetical protein